MLFRSRSRLSTGTRYFRINALLRNSVTALVFSVLPLLVAAHGVSGPLLWTVSLSLLGVAQLATITWSAKQVQPLSFEEVPYLLRAVMFSLVTISILYELYVIVFQPEFLTAIYTVGVAVSFIVGLVHFCLLVVSIQTSAEGAGNAD